jgi:hypothetical protein
MTPRVDGARGRARRAILARLVDGAATVNELAWVEAHNHR